LSTSHFHFTSRFTCRKVIIIPIIEEESYEKDVLFYLEISDPIPLGGEGKCEDFIRKICCQVTFFRLLLFIDNDVPLSNTRKAEMTKAEIIALEGWPKLGPDNRAQIRIKESKEFKVM